MSSYDGKLPERTINHPHENAWGTNFMTISGSKNEHLFFHQTSNWTTSYTGWMYVFLKKWIKSMKSFELVQFYHRTIRNSFRGTTKEQQPPHNEVHKWGSSVNLGKTKTTQPATSTNMLINTCENIYPPVIEHGHCKSKFFKVSFLIKGCVFP